MLDVRHNAHVQYTMYVEIDTIYVAQSVEFRVSVKYDLVERFDSVVRLTLVS